MNNSLYQFSTISQEWPKLACKAHIIYGNFRLLWNIDFFDEQLVQRMREESADFRMGKNGRFRKRDKITDFENGTQSQISKTRQNCRFVAIKIASYVSFVKMKSVKEKRLGLIIVD